MNSPRAQAIAVAAMAFVTLIGVAGAIEESRSPVLGPSLRDADGRFSNPTGPLGHGSFGVRFPFGLRRIYHSIVDREGFAPFVENDGAYLRENALHSEPTVTWIGHATVLVQFDHVSILTDPIWAKRASPVGFAGPPRRVEPGVAIPDLPPIHAVVVSHNHFDHLDLATLVALARRDPHTRFLVPLGNGDLLREQGIANVEELDWGERVRVGTVAVHCLPAQHWSRRGLRDRNEALWSSWALIGNERRFFFAGDTGYFAGFEAIGKALGPFDLAALPIGAYLPTAMMEQAHVNPEEAFQAGLDLRAERMLGVHWGTFDLADEPLDEPPRRFLAAAAEADSGDRAWIFKVGETRGF